MHSPLQSLLPAIERFADVKLCCIGDVMLDRFIYGEVTRISPEAPIPVLARSSSQTMLGGAGNVVRNIVSLGASCSFISVVGDDAVGREVMSLIAAEAHIEPAIVTESGRKTTEKTRFVAGYQQLLRCDDETRQPISAESHARIVQWVESDIAQYDALILSDYNKGLLQPELVQQLIELARNKQVPVLIDPKRADWSCYRGATVISPNLNELKQASGCDSNLPEHLMEAAGDLCARYDLGAVLVTRGKDGMSLFQRGEPPVHIPALPREVFDVSGAGDTSIATLAVAHASGLPLADAAKLANLAAGIVVGRLGTATIYRTDLTSGLYSYEQLSSQSKIMPQAVAADAITGWKRDGFRIGFTNGCFDVLHAGHLALLQDAKARCDKLVIGVNSDASVSRLKGPTRPLNQEMDRAMLLAAMDPVDLVVIFRDDTPLSLIDSLKPDLLMKGADYTIEQVVGAKEVMAYGGSVELIPLREGYSTTALIEKARSHAS